MAGCTGIWTEESILVSYVRECFQSEQFYLQKGINSIPYLQANARPEGMVNLGYATDQNTREYNVYIPGEKPILITN